MTFHTITGDLPEPWSACCLYREEPHKRPGERAVFDAMTTPVEAGAVIRTLLFGVDSPGRGLRRNASSLR